nr:cytochrome P450 6DF3 [Pagiophloeus tsushimanus]
MTLFLVVALVCSIPLLLVIFSKWRNSYWSRKGVAQLNPEFFYGDLRQMLTGKISVGEAFNDIYFKFKKKNLRYGGIYWTFKPVFMPIDIRLIKDIMQNSFAHFTDRGGYQHEKDVLSQNLFRMEGQPWKQLRAKMTPTFTSSRMKMMFETLCEKIVCLQKVTEPCVRNKEKINVTDVASRFTTDIIGSCAFGIECDSLQNPDCEFRVYGKQINRPRPLKQLLEKTLPNKILYYIGYKSFPLLEDFFRNIVMKTIDHREKNEVFRKDFMHLLLQLRNRGVLSDDGKLTRGSNEQGILTDDEVVAQCFLFFAAGFDTSSTTMAFTLFELAKNPDIQEKMRKEISQVFQKYGGKLTYEGAKELIFTEKIISETLRRYPILPAIPRLCTKAYKIPGSNVVLEKGTAVQIPAWGIHMDPEYYPNPEVFDPERFSEEEKSKRPDFTHIPFGEGPRVCIGARFGMLQAKVGLVGLIKDHRFSLPPEAPRKLSFKPSMSLLNSSQDIWLNVDRI